MTVLIAILLLGILIFVHELGHFLVAKWNKVGVLEFAIGFGRQIWKKKINGTTYALRLIPLGGFVRMVGEDPTWAQFDPNEIAAGDEHAASPTAEQLLVGDSAEQLDEDTRKMLEDQSQWFVHKSLWAKSAVVFAGPLANLLFAIFISILSYGIYGKVVSQDVAKVGEVIPNFPAEKAGIQKGDVVKAIDAKPISTWTELAQEISTSAGRELKFTVVRKGENGADQELVIPLKGTLETDELDLLEGSDRVKSVKVGIIPHTGREPVTWGEAIWFGPQHVYYLCGFSLRGLYGMVSGIISPKNIAGPIGIFKEGAKRVQQGLEHIFEFLIFLSVSLAILNLLPIPVLDGGHLLFFLIEGIKGSPLNERAHALATSFGMAVLLLLMAFAVGNDLWKLVSG